MDETWPLVMKNKGENKEDNKRDSKGENKGENKRDSKEDNKRSSCCGDKPCAGRIWRLAQARASRTLRPRTWSAASSRTRASTPQESLSAAAAPAMPSANR